MQSQRQPSEQYKLLIKPNPETLPNFATQTDQSEWRSVRQDVNLNSIRQSIDRLDSFLSYLSDKIKSNTRKVSLHDATNLGVDGTTENSQTTASRSDLSIDEFNLVCYKEYMLLDDKRPRATSQSIPRYKG